MDLAVIPENGTMNSLEIARLTGKRHDNVCRDIEDQLGQLGGGVLRFEDTHLNEQNGQRYRCYRLPKRECMILASGYDVILRAKIIDRWAELEMGSRPKDLTRLEILRMALESEEKVQALEAQRLLDAPKVAAQELLSGARGAFGIREAGKQVGLGQKAFVDFLVARKIMYRLSGDLVPFQQWIDAGYFAIATGTSVHGEDAFAWRQAKFTAKGIAWIAEKVGALAI